jgi:integrase
MPVYRDRRTKRWRYRKVVRSLEGPPIRISGTPTIDSRAAAEAEERAHIARVCAGKPARKEKQVPRFEEFQKEFMQTYVAANNKPSERMAKEYMFKYHLLPAFGRKRLDEITTRHVEALKAEKLEAGLAPKTVNNMISCLGKMLRYAADCDELEKLPRLKFVKTCRKAIDFLTFEELERLVEAANAEPEGLAAVLLAADAGLRNGEIRALEWGDLDLVARRVTVQRTDYRGYLGSPKGGRIRTLPLTQRLTKALKAIRHLKGEHVFSDAAGVRWSRGEADTLLRRAFKRAGLRKIGWHTLRHTFCSHLAMRGAPIRTIQELAGHASITTTMGYMHLTPSATRQAIDLLEQPSPSAAPNSVATAWQHEDPV